MGPQLSARLLAAKSASHHQVRKHKMSSGVDQVTLTCSRRPQPLDRPEPTFKGEISRLDVLCCVSQDAEYPETEGTLLYSKAQSESYHES